MIESGPKQPENRIHLFDPVGLINEKYSNYGARPRHVTASNNNNNFAGTRSTSAIGAREGGLKFAVEPKVSDSDSESSSPRFWNINSRNSPPTSPKFTFGNPHQHPLQSSNNRQSLTHQPFHPYPEPMSPTSRTEAIARGRRELMEMIKDIPESCYELSLRDIVDHKPVTTPPPPPPQAASPSRPPPPAVAVQQSPREGKRAEAAERKLPQQQEAPEATKGKKGKKKKGSKKVGKSDSKKKMMKNKTVDNGGFLLKTSVFPIPFRSKKKKRGLNPAPSFKVAPKSPSKGSVKGGGERHWWARKSRVSSDSGGLASESPRSSDGSSRSSSVIVNRNRLPSHRFLPSCCAFFNDKKMIKA